MPIIFTDNGGLRIILRGAGPSTYVPPVVVGGLQFEDGSTLYFEDGTPIRGEQ